MKDLSAAKRVIDAAIQYAKEHGLRLKQRVTLEDGQCCPLGAVLFSNGNDAKAPIIPTDAGPLLPGGWTDREVYSFVYGFDDRSDYEIDNMHFSGGVSDAHYDLGKSYRPKS